jgi:hypothetical protein
MCNVGRGCIHVALVRSCTDTPNPNPKYGTLEYEPSFSDARYVILSCLLARFFYYNHSTRQLQVLSTVKLVT